MALFVPDKVNLYVQERTNCLLAMDASVVWRSSSTVSLPHRRLARMSNERKYY